MRVEKGRKVVGSFIVTTSIADGVTGFAGKVPVVLALNTEGKIIGLRLLENQESPGFIKRIARKGFSIRGTIKRLKKLWSCRWKR